MPELPEVEVTRRRIAPKIVGRKIRAVRTTKASYFFLTPPKELERRLTGRRVASLMRHGKYLVATLDDGSRLFLHLGMTGQLFTASARSVRLLSSTRGGALTPERQDAFEPDGHTHLALSFEDADEDVLFRDVRKFGKVRWLPSGASDPRLDKLGPDALTTTAARLYEETRKRKMSIKTVLLDQGVVAGVGNIYADEALFRAGIRPKRAARTLTRKECERLADEIRAVLQRSIETGGSSISDYVQPDGSDGAYQNERRVYARKGEPCYACETPIKRIVLSARSTHYCPTCQK
ncbi:MAG: Formamidopyrimidine-DNA glycosylase [Myxococcaceae bacterium]|nr:Formamidopyrimidine-DNA glycosylase [Myxococcaceae bacterium]